MTSRGAMSAAKQIAFAAMLECSLSIIHLLKHNPAGHDDASGVGRHQSATSRACSMNGSYSRAIRNS